ncbi:MAG TPA: phenylalanine--tRNA ligase subunit beta, partial [Vicinamibacteria bacterium]|nr:phenylalanine--tRNA ligase subunit beta [Vicinamibacteria bacterium]
MGVVADEEVPLALAGVMGGAASEVSDATHAVLLEAAYWSPLAIRRAARSLGLHTEASHRFERGADPDAPPLALDRIAHLARKIGAGTARPGRIDRVAVRRTPKTIVFRPARATAVIGVAVSTDETRRILRRLEFEVDPRDVGAWRVTVPSWRGDVSREDDVVEEVARHHGLSRVPSTLPPARGPEGLRPYQVLERRVRDVLAGAGLSEVITYSFVPRSAADGPRTIGIDNPLSEDQGVLRSSLVMPGLVSALAANLRHARRDVREFEVGRVFAAGEALAEEERRVGLLLTGRATPVHFGEAPRAADFFDLKGVVETLAARLGADPLEWEPGAAQPWLHPGQSATLRRDGREAGWAGALHPDEAARLGAREPVLVAELSLDALAATGDARMSALPRFPAVERDLSLVVPTDVTAAALEG